MKELIQAIEENIKSLEDVSLDDYEVREILEDYKRTFIDLLFSLKYVFESIEKRREERDKKFDEIINNQKKCDHRSMKYFT